MCLIIFCPKDSNKNDDFLEEAIRKAHEYNPDGMGYSIKREDNSLFLNKGFFNVDKFIEEIKNEKVKDSEELLIHLRIGNKGKVNVEMSHPFVVSDRSEEILDTIEGFVDKPILAHNGTMSRHAVTNSDKSDTYFFIKNVLSKKSVQNFLSEDPVVFEDVMYPHLSSSRLCVLFPEDKETVLLGKWHEINGYKFSKDYHVEYFPKEINTYSSVNCYGYNSSYYDDFEDFEDLRDGYKRNKSLIKDYNHSFDKENLIKIPFIGVERPFFKDFIGVKHSLYMGLYLPESSTTISYTKEVTNLNLKNVSVECKESDYEIGIYKFRPYRVVSVINNRVTLVDLDDVIEVEISSRSFYELFKIQYFHDRKIWNSMYYSLVKKIEVTQSMVKKLEKVITRASVSSKTHVKFRDLTIPFDLAVSFLNHAEHELELKKTPELLLF